LEVPEEAEGSYNLVSLSTKVHGRSLSLSYGFVKAFGTGGEGCVNVGPGGVIHREIR
jgi:hypothetical protein